MNFLLCINKNKPVTHNFQILLNNDDIDPSGLKNFLKISYIKKTQFKSFHNDNLDVFILGDLINTSNESDGKFLELLFSNFTYEKIRALKGHFYIIIIDKIADTITCYNSLFSILPIYIYEAQSKIIISSSVKMIKDQAADKLKASKKFIVEKLLFNYAFLNDTIYEEVKLLPSNHFIKISDKLEVQRHTTISDYFIDRPVSWHKAIDPISNLFLDKLKYYFPTDHFYMTLTGGFDGRTLVGYALSNKLEFKTFSYGSIHDKDIQVPLNVSKAIGFEHETFILSEEYAQKDYIKSLESLVLNTDCNASLSRSHYAYIASLLSAKTDYFLSGNFGSEIIRTMRVPGVMTSDFLLRMFDLNDDNLIYKELSNNPGLDYLRKENIKLEIERIYEQIIAYKKNQDSRLNANQKFYIYLFEEVFRKYFGPELIIQNHYALTNRTPFLDFGFIEELLKTELAGVNGRYLESNPFLRFRGQILYSYILKILNSPLLNLPTDRGYRPKDFFSLNGKLNIIRNYANNNYLNKRDKKFTAYNHLCFNLNKKYFESLEIKSDIFREDILQLENEVFNDKLSHALSLIIYCNKFI